jgi:2,5-diamino-6-(ribosylamino)-4(3H)-pyrimidinone 5'-phosphate reductase
LAGRSSGPPGRRPIVWANCAVSLDGRLAYAGGRRANLSGPKDLARVQQLRRDSDGVVVGVGTVVADDPSLRVHDEMLLGPPGKSPWRIILDSNGRTPPTARVLDGSLPTIVATSATSSRVWPDHVRVLRSGSNHVDLGHLLTQLFDLGLRTVLVEGGAKVLASLLRAGLFDRLTVYVAPVLIGGTTAPSLIMGDECYGPEGVVGLSRVSVEGLDDGALHTYLPGRNPRGSTP